MSRSRPISSLSLAPHVLAQLTREGYETVEDLARERPEILSQAKAAAATSAPTQPFSLGGPSSSQLPSTQIASSLFAASRSLPSTGTTALDRLLGGGLSPGHILELSGPPGCCKEKLVVALVKQYVKDGTSVVFVDCQNAIPPEMLRDAIKEVGSSSPGQPPSQDPSSLVSYSKIHTAVELFVFLHNLPSLAAHATTQNKILVLNTLSFLFQPFLSTNVNQSTRNAFLDRLKAAVVSLSATHKYTIVTTSQLSVRLLNADGTNGNFQTAVTSTMMPQIGNNYLPAGKSYRVMVVPETRTIGKLRLLSSPRNQMPEKGSWAQEDYDVESLYSPSPSSRTRSQPAGS